jgi:iron complex outermembrane recepter protein
MTAFRAPFAPTPLARAALLALLASQAALAAAQAGKLEVIEVTASKRIEKLEQVPAAISVLTTEMIERQNVRNLDDVVNMTPAITVTYGSTPANNGINMRGIGTSSIGIGVEADVAVVIDDIPLGQQFMAFRDLSDVMRIEVLKGPQSTLVGKNAIAGAISIVTKPVTGALRGEASAMYTSDREYRLRASYGGDLSDTFGLRVAVSSNDFEGNVNNLTLGRKVNGTRGHTVLAKAVWRPIENLDVEFSPRYNYSNASCCALVATRLTPIQGAIQNNIPQLPATELFRGIDIGPGNRDVRNDVVTGIESKTAGAGLRVGYQIGDSLLTSITSAEHYKADDIRDQDFVDAPTLLYYPLANGRPAGVNASYIQYGHYDIKSTTQELRFTSPDRGPVKYVVGLWYGKNDIYREFTRGYNGIAASTPARYIGTTYNINKALFGQLSWEFLPKYLLTVGGRFNEQESGYTFLRTNPPPLPLVQTDYFEGLGNKEKANTGKVAIQHQFDKGLMAYALYSTGYKGQAYDITSGLTAATAAQLPVPSETAKNFELGMKGNFLDNSLTVNLTLFQAKFKNYQQNSGSYLPNTTTFVTRLNSVGGVQTEGAEIDIAAALTPSLLLNLSAAYTEAVVTDWRNAPCYNVAGSPNGGFNAECQLRVAEFGNTNVQDLKGRPMPNAPRLKINASGRYDFPVVGLKGFSILAVKYQSGVVTNINQDPDLAAPQRTVVDLGLGFSDDRERHKFTLTVNNLLNKPYANTGFTGLGSWSSRAPNPVVNVATSTYTPARDAFRYLSARFDMKF